MRKGEEEFNLDLTRKESNEETANNDLQYSRDESVLENNFLKEIKDEEREEERRLWVQQGQQLLKKNNSDPEEQQQSELHELERNPSLNADDRRKQRRAIFEKYKKKELEAYQGNSQDIMQTFDEIFKRKSGKRPQGITVSPEKIITAPVIAFKRTDSSEVEEVATEELISRGIQSGGILKSTEKRAPQSKQMFDSVRRSFDMELSSAMLSSGMQSSLNLSDSNVLADPTNSFEIPPPRSANPYPQTVIPTHISLIRSLNTQNNDTLKDQSLELEDLLSQNIFSDVSQDMMKSIDAPKEIVRELKLPATMQQIDMKKKGEKGMGETQEQPKDNREMIVQRIFKDVENFIQAEEKGKEVSIDDFIEKQDVKEPVEEGESIHYENVADYQAPTSIPGPNKIEAQDPFKRMNELLTNHIFPQFIKPQAQAAPASGSPNSSNVSSTSLSASLLSNLSDPTFPQPLANPQICQLLREAFRLNSVGINIYNPATHIFLPRLKQMLRKTVFEMSIATQSLWTFNEEIYQKELQQKKMYVNFKPEVFMAGKWCLPIIRSVTVLKGDMKSGQPRRRGEYNQIQGALSNAGAVLKELGTIIEALRIDPSSKESLGKYIALKKAFNDLMSNFLRISQDLYNKASIKYLPDHYNTFFQLLKNSQPGNTDLRVLLRQRQDMLMQVLYLRDQRDPLCSSVLGADIFNKLHTDIRRLKSDIALATRL